MKRLLFLLITLLVLTPARAQEFIGMTEKSIRENMSRDYPDMTCDNMVRNDYFTYLKYYSADGNETWLIFLDGRGQCNGIRVTCGSSSYHMKMKELNDRYRTEGENRWSYRTGNEEIDVKLQQEECFFTVTHQRATDRTKSGNNRAS
ncbi:MAG: hypothetical protein GX622_13145 [Bacteroidales bacterium]|nr:hypothetical protein [Bacteroidales bacterium]